MSDQITFKCKNCGHAVSIDKDNPPKDEDILSCFGCGQEFGTFSAVKSAMKSAAKAEIDKLIRSKFGKSPTWRKS